MADQLKVAGDDITSGRMALWEAFKAYEIPYRTLRRHVESQNFIK